MWGCDYGPVSSGWWGGFFPGGLFSLLIWGVMILLLIYLGARIFRSLTSEKPSYLQDRADSIAILKARFAKGEVSEEEYHKMKQVISGA
jgi:putative membrane protein